MKKFLCLLLALVMCAAMLTACGGDSTPTELSYQVTVTDALGVPVTEGVVVKFLKDGQQAAMQTVNAEGVAEKVLPTGDYTVELVFTDVNAEYHYDVSQLVLNAQQPSASVELLQKVSGEPVELYASGEDTDAYNVNTGCTYVELQPGRNYFLFTPTQSGDYAFSVSGNTHTVGMYGSPYFVQENSIGEDENGVLKTTVKDSMIGTGNTGTSTYVIGVDAQEAGSCILVVERLGDPTWDPSDAPWTVYETTATLSNYTLPAGAQLQNFDLTAESDAYELVYNDSDGYYHLGSADGSVVLVYLTEPSAYLDDFETICGKSHVCKYFYKEDGSFDHKESYNECLMDYFPYADPETGVYPLTDDLIYIIQNRGEYYGWFDYEAGGAYLFYDANGNPDKTINKEIAWMFALCYVA